MCCRPATTIWAATQERGGAPLKRQIPAVALLALGAVIGGCSSPGEKPADSVASSASAAPGLADFPAQASPLSMNRACTTDVASAECGKMTAAKIDLNKQIEPQLKAAPATGPVGDAVKISERIAGTGEAWSRLGCQTEPATPACASPAMAVESDFSVLSAYLLQITGG